MSGSGDLQANRPHWPRPPLAPPPAGPARRWPRPPLALQPRLVNLRGPFVSRYDAKGPDTLIYRFRVASRVAA